MRTMRSIIIIILDAILLFPFFMAAPYSGHSAPPPGRMVQPQSPGYKRAEELSQNVVRVEAAYSGEVSEKGFGFIVGELVAGEGSRRLYIVTADHIVRSDKARTAATSIKVMFKSLRGQWEPALLLDTRLSKPQDLAVLVVKKPEGFSWENNFLASPIKPSLTEQARYIGRDGDWVISASDGRISKAPDVNSVFEIEFNIDTVREGSSGAPVLTENGIKGMILSSSGKGRVHALWIGAIKKAFADWTHPWGIVEAPKNKGTPCTVTAEGISEDMSDDFKWQLPPKGWTFRREGEGHKNVRLYLENAPALGYFIGRCFGDSHMEFNLKLDDNKGAAWAIGVLGQTDYFLFYLSGPEGLFPNMFVTYYVQPKDFIRGNQLSGDYIRESHVRKVGTLAVEPGVDYVIKIDVKGNRITHSISSENILIEHKRDVRLDDFDSSKFRLPYGSIGFQTIDSEKFSVDDILVDLPHLIKR